MKDDLISRYAAMRAVRKACEWDYPYAKKSPEDIKQDAIEELRRLPNAGLAQMLKKWQMGELDKAFHLVASATENVHWHDFREVGLDEPYYDYYYAEDGLYCIRDRVCLRLWFCQARSPKEAWQKYEDQCRQFATAWGGETE